jgi:D-3-phosphoglycerate dehydrogenase
MKVLHLDSNHPILEQGLAQMGIENHFDYNSSKEAVLKTIDQYQGIIIRSRFSIDKSFLDAATRLKFIGRVGAGLENIDIQYAKSKGIVLISAPEGNRNAVGEHALGMLLSLFNNLNKGDREVKNGIWDREGNRGYEIEGKTIGIIGYGNMGKAFAKTLAGFDCEVLCYDIDTSVGDHNAKQVSLAEFQSFVDVVSMHLPQDDSTINLMNASFIKGFSKPFWLINTGRGKTVKTADLVEALKTGQILGAGLDVLEYEKTSFEQLNPNEIPLPLQYLRKAENVLLSPHVAGWTFESHRKLAQTIVDKVKSTFF